MAKIFHSIQYVKATGQIIGRITGGQRIPDENFPPEAAQIVHEDDDKNTFPDVAMKRINLANLAAGGDLAACMELCPVLAVQKQVNDVQGQLVAIDNATARSLREFYCTGDNTALKGLEARAVPLRKRLTELNSQLAAIPAQKPPQ